MSIVIRTFQKTDFDTVARLEEGRKRNRYGACVFVRQSAELYPGTFLVADDRGSVVGYTLGAQVQGDPADAWVLRLMVASRSQKKGVGTALISHLISELADREVRNIFLSVAPDNVPAKKIYTRLGFVKVAYHHGYFGEGEDREIMRYEVNL